MKYYTPTKKEDIVKIIAGFYEKANKEYGENLSDDYYRGMYIMATQIASAVKIYEKEESKR